MTSFRDLPRNAANLSPFRQAGQTTSQDQDRCRRRGLAAAQSDRFGVIRPHSK